MQKQNWCPRRDGSLLDERGFKRPTLQAALRPPLDLRVTSGRIVTQVEPSMNQSR